MKILLLAVLLVVTPTFLWAGETTSKDRGGFDFDQPFDDAMAKGLLRSLLNRALDAIEDHVEMRGKLRHGAQAGEEEGRLELRVYPRGKSQSGDHVTAEGWFRFSPDLLNNEMSFRFKSSQDSVDRSGAPDVL
jgi:hypothetical protein